MGKPTICIGQKKGVVTAKLISAFVFATRIVQFLFYLNPKFQASSSFLCAGTGRFVSDLFGNHIVGFPTRRLRYHPIPHFYIVKMGFARVDIFFLFLNQNFGYSLESPRHNLCFKQVYLKKKFL